MDYRELARNVVESNGEASRVATLCDALGRDEDALLDALDDAILQHGDSTVQHGDSTVPVTSVRAAAASAWRNWGGNQVVHPTEQHDVATLKTADLQRAVQRAAAANRPIKLVGSGHSFSDVVQTDGVLLYRSEASYAGDVPLLAPIDLATLKTAPDRMFLQLAANAKLSELNAALARQNLAFRNLGGAAFQTLAGAISTSTHGSGVTLGALCDEVRSVLLIDAEGQLRRLEPANGITDLAKHKARHPEVALIQDDELFRAWSVSMGCMAIAVQITMEVTKAYKLRETRAAATWGSLKRELAAGAHLEARHFEVVINPYPNEDGDHDCVTTTRVVVPSQTPSSNPGGRPGRWFASRRVFQRLIQQSVQRRPEHIPKLIARSLNNLLKIGEFVSDSYRVFDVGHVNDIRAVSQELAFELGAEAIEAIDALLAQVADQRGKGRWHTGPIALRFVAASPAYLSMMSGRATCMVELPMIDGTPHWQELFDGYERIAAQFAGRPHWGQYHSFTGEPGWLDAHYDHAAKWIAALHQLDPHGRFDNAFARRMRFRNPPSAT